MNLIFTLILMLAPMALTAQDLAINEKPSQSSDSKTETGELSKIKMVFPFAEKDWGITSGFGWRWLNGKLNFHTGVDIAAYCGTEVLAAHSGRVFKIGEDNVSGRYIVIESDDQNYRTYYLHLNGAPKEVWTINTPVEQGKTVIGYVGQTASPQGAHLHFELQYKEENETEFKVVNPMTFISDYKPKQ